MILFIVPVTLSYSQVMLKEKYSPLNRKKYITMSPEQYQGEVE